MPSTSKTEAKAIEEVNSQISGDASSLMSALHNEHTELENIDNHNQLHYLTLLQAALQAKIQVCMYVPVVGSSP